MSRFRLLPVVFGAGLLAGLLLRGGPSSAFIDVFRPQTLGAACDRAQSITVLKVDKFSKEKGVILYKKVKDLKGKYPAAGLREHLGAAHLADERKHYLDWAREGKTAVVFRYENRQAVCIGEQWTVCDSSPPKDEKALWTSGTRTEPWFLLTYCGSAEKLVPAVEAILAGKEVVVPTMLGARDKELRQRTGKAQRMRTSLERKDYNLKRDAVGEGEKGPTGATADRRPRRALDEPLPLPGMGWSTYNFFIARHNEELFKGMAEAFEKSGLRDAGYTTLRIDGGWWGHDGRRRHYYWTEAGKYADGSGYRPGDPHVDPRNYPNGLKGLADHLHKRGLKLGFYLSPSLSTGGADNYPGNKDVKVAPPVKGLALVARHARFVADGGVDHLFYDGYDWNKSQGLGAYVEMAKALRAEARRVKRPIAFSINTGWAGRHPEWADEWRTGQDVNGKWGTILECLSRVASPGPAGKGRWNNPDYLMVGFVGDEEAKSQMSLWCVAAAPLYLSHDFRVLNAHDRYVLLNTEAIAIDRDAARKPGRRVRASGGTQVWARELADGSRAVVLLNAGEKVATVEVTWKELGLPAGEAHVRDLWAHKGLGRHKGGYTARDLPAHGCAFLKVTPGGRPTPEPKATWAAHPGPRPSRKPLDRAGWKVTTNSSHFDAAKVLDGKPETGASVALAKGRYLELAFRAPTEVNELLVDSVGVGPNAWPYEVFAPRSRFVLELSEDGKAFRKVAESSLGPSYTLVRFDRARARKLRLTVTEVDRTSAHGAPSWEVREVFAFNAEGKRARP